MKNISLTLKDEKFKTEEKMVKMGNQADSALLMKDEFGVSPSDEVLLSIWFGNSFSFRLP